MKGIVLQRLVDLISGIIIGLLVSYYSDFIYLKMRQEGLTPSLPFIATGNSGAPRKVDVFLVPFEGFEESSADLLAKSLSKDTGLSVSRTGSISLPKDHFNQARNQYDVDYLNQVVNKSIKNIRSGSEKQLFIAIVKQDMYSSSNSWNFTLAGNFENGISIIATERLVPMETQNYKEAEKIYGARLYKMLKRTIGLQYYGRSRSQNPESLLYSPVMDVRVIDGMKLEY